jgi:hypothetical protein
MKAAKQLLAVAVRIAVSSAVLMTLVACGGSQEAALIGNSRATGADGTVQVEEIEGGNSLVTISMQHLPPPDRIGTGNTVYVAWFVAPGQAPVRAGTLSFDSDSREGSMMATTPLRTFELKITAERSANAASPSENSVATRQITVED